MKSVNDRSASAVRLARLRQAMEEAGIDVLFIRDTSNIRWLTAIDGVFDAEQAHAVAVSADRAALHTDSRYSEALRSHAEAMLIEIDGTRESHAAFLNRFLKAEAHADAVGFEDTIPFREYVALSQTLGRTAVSAVKKAEGAFRAEEASPVESSLSDQTQTLRISLVPTTGIVEGLRASKDASEVEAMAEAQAITDAAFAYICGFIEEGMTEREVQLELDRFMLDAGADGLAFDTIVASGPNGSRPHAVPGERRIAQGDAIVMDFGARKHGYCSDMTRTVFVGEPDAKKKAAWKALRRANEECEAMIAPGISACAVAEQAERILEEEGFGGLMGHGLGHGVGIDIHEAPSLSAVNNKALAKGDVVTVEPGIYIPGGFGMRLEDFGVVTDDGYRVLTQSTHEMVIIGNR